MSKRFKVGQLVLIEWEDSNKKRSTLRSKDIFWELGNTMGARMFRLKENAHILNIIETKECWLCEKKYKRLGWLERHVGLKHGVGA